MRIRVKDFQSLNSVDVEVGGLTVLVGPSNRGKSALVRAVEAALFNKPGDEFVRTGSKKAVVEILDAPGLLHQLTWTKGAGKTIYQHGLNTYSKVGQGTPPALTEAGYRDIWVGDKDRKKGEWIRPQVSAQHDPIFLLTRSGSFVSDVLGAISRHAVLLTAQDRATGDQRSTKQQLGYAQTGLAAATQQLEALADVPALAERVAALQALDAARAALADKVARVKALLAWRATYRPVAAAVLPPAASGRYPLDPLDQGLRILGVGYALADRRPRLNALLLTAQGLTLPTPADTSALDQLVVRRAAARGLLGHRPRVAALAGCKPAPDPANVLVPLEGALGLFLDTSASVAKRRAALDMLRRCETAVTSTEIEVDEAQAALDTLLAEIQTCPTCEQPWPR